MKKVIGMTAKEVKALNSTELRATASTLKVKNYAKFGKEQLQDLVIKAIKDANQPVKTLSKSQILRQEIAEMSKNKLSIDSGSLIARLKDKFGIVMHRSFVITVRNKHLATVK